MTDITRKLEMTYMTRKLPAEMMDWIFRLLPLHTLKMVVLVCRRWRGLGEDSMLWCQLCLTVNERNLSFMSEMLSSRRLQDVRELSIKTSVTEEVLQSVMRHPGLRKLEIHWFYVQLTTQQTELIFSALCEYSRLKYLDISNVNISSVEPRLLAGKVKVLETLKVRGTQLTTEQIETILAAISEDSRLKSLDISWNNLSSVKPGLLTGAVKVLETLNVEGAQLTTQQLETILTAIIEDSQLKYLFISWNNLSSVEPGLLTGAVKVLEILTVRYGQLTTKQLETILAAIGKDSKLNSLDISGNNMKLVDPGLLDRADKAIQMLDFEDCYFSDDEDGDYDDDDDGLYDD